MNNTTYNRFLNQRTFQTELGAFRSASNASKRIKSDAEEQPVVLFVLAMERCAISNSSFVVSGETQKNKKRGFNITSEVFLC